LVRSTPVVEAAGHSGFDARVLADWPSCKRIVFAPSRELSKSRPVACPWFRCEPGLRLDPLAVSPVRPVAKVPLRPQLRLHERQLAERHGQVPAEHKLQLLAEFHADNRLELFARLYDLGHELHRSGKRRIGIVSAAGW
jgi:hypothetical protein